MRATVSISTAAEAIDEIKSYKRIRRSNDPSKKFRDWHFSLGHGLPSMDIDFVEYRPNREGELIPVAMYELTCSEVVPIPPRYLDQVWTRLFHDKPQARVMRYIARIINVPALIVLHTEDLTDIWVYNVLKMGRWYHTTLEDLGEWIDGLRVRE